MIVNDEPYTLPRPSQDPVPPAPTLAWTYDGADPALMLFTAAVQRFGLTFPSGSRVLELGCAESDWLERMARMDPTLELMGMDTRHQERRADGFTLVEGSALDGRRFATDYFDRIVLLGALEHFGLGFYGDPKDDHGDVIALRNVYRWLKPGGLVYFDVPCQPTYRVSENHCYRSYSPAGIHDRLLEHGRYGLHEVARGYSLPEPNAGTWVDEPTEERVPYWFCAVLAEKR